jgi:ribosomal protein S18 acetylase RimI-like enzyme
VRASQPLEIRPAGPWDVDRLIAILYDTFESTWQPNISPFAAKAFREEDRPTAYVARRGHEFWVCECAKDVVGFVDWQGDFVNALHVRGSHARLGAGTFLMDKAEAEIGRAGFSAARLETDTFNTKSQQFYARRGYEEVDRYPDMEWSSGLVTILLRKPLK